MTGKDLIALFLIVIVILAVLAKFGLRWESVGNDGLFFALINIFLDQSIRNQGMPFRPSLLPKEAFEPDTDQDIQRRIKSVHHGNFGKEHHLIEK